MVTDAQQRMVHLIARMSFLTPEQVCRRYYSPRSITRVQALLKDLADQQVLVRRGWERQLEGGSRPYVYSLSPRTRSQLVDAGYLPQQRYRPSEDLAMRQYPSHTLAVNDVLITAEAMTGEYRLDHFIHERTIQRFQIPYKPDAYIELTNGERHPALLLEVDRGTEAPDFWARKIERLVRFVDSNDYDRVFRRFHGVLIVAEPLRLQRLQEWTTAELTRMGRSEDTRLFFYATSQQARDPAVFAPVL